jgi:hypothetical protein
MKLSPLSFSLLGLAMIATHAFAQEPKKQDDTPVPFPKLEHFAALWERSIFTTKDLPSPDAPTGPNFADNYNISGTYEFDGAVTFVLVDKTTSQFMEARIGSENEFGIKVRAVKPGETVDKTRIQLQKGDQAGWVSFADLAAAPPVEVRSAIPSQQSSAQNQPQQGQGMQQRGSMNAPPARAGLSPNPLLPGPPPSTPIPGGAASPAPKKDRDVPLPPS